MTDSELTRVLAALERRCQAPGVRMTDNLDADAARLLREIAKDFGQLANKASECAFCDSPWLEDERARWRLE